ncbi:MAG: AAA family ATPase [Candidatus Dormibacteria bacterium]
MPPSPLHLTGVEVLWREVSNPEEYPFAIAAIRQLTELTLGSPVTYLVGENGSGKSTLLEAIASAAGLNPEGGSRNLNFETRRSHSSLDEHLRLTWHSRPRSWFFLRAESFYNVATAYESLPEPITGYHERSHRELFLRAIQSHFRGDGLYLLDEPESALSLVGQLQLMAVIHRLQAVHSQFLIATHSPILMAFPGAEILEMSESGIHQVDYRESEQYRLTRSFLEDPDNFLRHLFADEPEFARGPSPSS